MAERCLRIVDLETTGVDPQKDAIVEIACLDVNDGVISNKPYMSLVKPPIPIPPQTSAIHHIVDEDVASAPLLRDVIPTVLRPEDQPIYVAHNSAFESSFLAPIIGNDAIFLCTYKVALRRWPDAPAHNLQTLRYWLKLPVDRVIADQAHRAFPDVFVTAYLLLELLKDVPVHDMLMWTLEPPVYQRCPIGKKQGWYDKPWAAIDAGFLQWIVEKIDDNPDVVWNARHELERRRKATQSDNESKFAAERTAYVSLAKQALIAATSVSDLNQWFIDGAGERAKWGIVKGDALYREIVAACAAHKKTLPQPTTDQEAA